MELNKAIVEYCLRIADNSLIHAQRISEWTGHGPILEEDIAMSNIALDLIGQARGFYTYASQIEGLGKTEDFYAFQRGERDFRNKLMAEQPDFKDFGFAMMKIFLNGCFDYLLFRDLMKSKDETISGLAAKAIKEVTYHVRHAGDWMLRLGDGTAESHHRIQNSLNELWPYTNELFEMDNVDEVLIENGTAFDKANLKDEWTNMVKEIFAKATLSIPENTTYYPSGSLKGLHSEHLGFLLAEMQYLPRMYPDAVW
ncbi:MAG: 1,2-phenylacetyl-CoA epoxidase subunit PaaC [Bacteroidota bacterium]